MKINFMEREIVVTKKELQKASVMGSNEYEALIKAMADLPNFKLTIKMVRQTNRYYEKYRVA